MGSSNQSPLPLPVKEVSVEELVNSQNSHLNLKVTKNHIPSLPCLPLRCQQRHSGELRLFPSTSENNRCLSLTTVVGGVKEDLVKSLISQHCITSMRPASFSFNEDHVWSSNKATLPILTRVVSAEAYWEKGTPSLIQ